MDARSARRGSNGASISRKNQSDGGTAPDSHSSHVSALLKREDQFESTEEAIFPSGGKRWVVGVCISPRPDALARARPYLRIAQDWPRWHNQELFRTEEYGPAPFGRHSAPSAPLIRFRAARYRSRAANAANTVSAHYQKDSAARGIAGARDLFSDGMPARP
jgi:hypothetical protein